VNARFPAAVAGGNVETSQRIVDVLLRALASAAPDRIPAASCGSMNNIAIGGERGADGRSRTTRRSPAAPAADRAAPGSPACTRT
jgi:N-methylhydantoinase B